MLREIASLLTTVKGAAAATLIAGTAVTGGAVATVPEAREAVTESVTAVTTTLGSAVAAVAKAANERRAADTSCGKPEQVAQRNEADKQLRDAFQDDHKALTELHGGKDTNAVVKKAQDELRSVLTVALVAVAKETQGRTGQVAKANAAAADTTTTTTTTTTTKSASPSPRITFSEAQQTTSTGDTVACAEDAGKPADVTLNATLAALVKKATADMDAIVVKATADAGAVTPAEHGKPASDPARGNDNKPADVQKGKPSDKPGGKPSTR